jgi:hypothetical protein
VVFVEQINHKEIFMQKDLLKEVAQLLIQEHVQKHVQKYVCVKDNGVIHKLTILDSRCNFRMFNKLTNWQFLLD